tara:strand:- start:89 stop:292 length:204 start_codon:yes stop_codon:yes gene_type:complete
LADWAAHQFTGTSNRYTVFSRPRKTGAETRFQQSEVQAFIRGDHLNQEEVQQTENANGGASHKPQKH